MFVLIHNVEKKVLNSFHFFRIRVIAQNDYKRCFTKNVLCKARMVDLLIVERFELDICYLKNHLIQN